MMIPIVLYTNFEYSFLWKATIPLLQRYAAGFSVYWITDSIGDYQMPADWEIRFYDPVLPWSSRVGQVLKEISNEYLIYLQEDWLLIDNLSADRLAKFTKFMKQESCEFLMSYPFPWMDLPDFIKLDDMNIYTMPCHYMQPAIWKKTLLEELCSVPRGIKDYEDTNCFAITSTRNCLGVINQDYRVKLCLTTLSPLFPHMHAIIKGGWTFKKYPALKALVEAHGVDTTKRGINDDWFVEFH